MTTRHTFVGKTERKDFILSLKDSHQAVTPDSHKKPKDDDLALWVFTSMAINCLTVEQIFSQPQFLLG